jgi:hypothetical protein
MLWVQLIWKYLVWTTLIVSRVEIMWAKDPRSFLKSSLRILTNTFSSRIKIPKNETFAHIRFLGKFIIYVAHIN